MRRRTVTIVAVAFIFAVAGTLTVINYAVSPHLAGTLSVIALAVYVVVATLLFAYQRRAGTGGDRS